MVIVMTNVPILPVGRNDTRLWGIAPEERLRRIAGAAKLGAQLRG